MTGHVTVGTEHFWALSSNTEPAGHTHWPLFKIAMSKQLKQDVSDLQPLQEGEHPVIASQTLVSWLYLLPIGHSQMPAVVRVAVGLQVRHVVALAQVLQTEGHPVIATQVLVSAPNVWPKGHLH